MNGDRSEQLWQWVRRAPGQPIARREYSYRRGQTGGMLIERVLPSISFELEEEDGLSLSDVTTRAKAGFDVEKVTKRFYDRFKTEHEAFSRFLKGIPDESLQSWYVSVMLNRLMFIYFVQKKHFLDDDPDYLRNRLTTAQRAGRNRYYKHLLCPLFFEGFATQPEDRSPAVNKLLGTVPYLNGGLFLRHQIEEIHGEKIQIADAAFERLFDFFDAYRWHLDERPLRESNEINPDVLGYIFEKYINQKQMGAYYTKEDITDYIAKNTIIPFLFDAARKDCAIAFKPDGAVWRLLKDDPDRYIYPAVRHGVDEKLPKEIAAGIKDAAKRGGWNKPAVEEFALPTETWREHVARRQRCHELRRKLSAGEVTEINDLITLNLDIRQFAEDVIVTSEGPELVRAFWKAVERVTVLDPTCGSGAFLFAALNILEPLYEACLNRMEGLLDELSRSGKKHSPKKFADFRQVLDRIAQHANHRYFILKSIMVNNLFGVDIMEEATEICKLRLFLKLVAQVERVEQIEPLPDIDFNIRAGNTLVGFTSLDDVRRAITAEANQQLIQFDDTLGRVEEQARLADTAFKTFRQMQIEHDVSATNLADAKVLVRSRMRDLECVLDRHLAGEYGISPQKITNKREHDSAFAAWRKSHEPFHWLVDFYGIMAGGGFDVIIGNPPWAEYAKIKKTYTVRHYSTARCGNLYALCSERCLGLRSPRGNFSFIVQLPLANSSRMASLRDLLAQRSENLYAIPFDDRPGKLFDGLQHCRSVIFLSRASAVAGASTCTHVTRYQRWPTDTRSILFDRIEFCPVQHRLVYSGHFPKYGASMDGRIFEKILTASDGHVADYVRKSSTNSFIFYQEATQYWVKAVVGLPHYSKNGQVGAPPHGRYLYTSRDDAGYVLSALMNSTLFYAYFIAYSDCFHLSDRLVTHFPVPASLIGDGRLTQLGRDLNDDLRAKALQKMIMTKDGHRITYAEFVAGQSKTLIDDIDQVMASHFAFTDVELDYIINYDIKYRMGGSDENGS